MAVNKASPIPPWASVKIEPKRAFKFILTLGDIPAWVVTNADRPNPNFEGGVKHEFLGHEFKYPGKLKWQDVSVTLVEPVDPDVSGQVLDAVIKAGYNPPSTWTADNEGWRTTFSKQKFVNGNFGDISVKVLDSNGNEVETWTLFNSFVSNVTYSKLQYDGSGINTVTLQFSYDYATVNITEINQN
tara:strand:- start:968 stop:1525 length:558 start_codon:yes stop_codon:yes gene_type:complete